MKQSRMLIPTLKEAPSDAEAISHQMLVRGGYIYQVSAGVWAYLPLAQRILAKINRLIRQQMDKYDGVEMTAPILLPADLWQKSGRYESYGDNLFKLEDRKKRPFLLGPTHEETFTTIVRDSLKSYKKLPLLLYQITDKFRDEERPRFGLLRGKEFIMWDGYSFTVDREGLDVEYDHMAKALRAIFDEVGLNYKVILADSGTIGGKGSQEFSAPAAIGEDTIVYTDGGYAANLEKATSKFTEKQQLGKPGELTKKGTPGAHSVDEAAESLEIDADQILKAMVYIAKDGQDESPVMVLMRGNDEVNEVKLTDVLDVDSVRLANDEEIAAVLPAHAGSLGPVGTAGKLKVIADQHIKGMVNMACGANEDGYHYINANFDRDFTVDQFADVRNVKEGEIGPDGFPLKFTNGIEVGNIFKLGTLYSRAFKAQVLNKQGKATDIVMGCYGIGVSRLLSAIAEQNNDDRGLIWPTSIAPFDVHVIPVNVKNDEQMKMANEITAALEDEGYEVLIDDRKERAGVKFADSDLIGLPLRITVGKKAKDGIVEIKLRRTGETIEVKQEEVVNNVHILLKQAASDQQQKD